MDDDELLVMVWSLQQQGIQFYLFEERIQAIETEADILEEQLHATNCTIAAILKHRLTKHFRTCFRVSSVTFRYLVDVSHASMLRQDTVVQSTITVEKEVAISLYLCLSAEERTIGHFFAVGESVVHESHRELCDGIIDELESRTVSMVRSQYVDHHKLKFQAVLRFLNGIGALDGCHLPVFLPKDSAFD
ncbi:hypothetical protein HPB47_000587 [Ixodes persulcatus]|uniref:Uncharacterized protein n=1 Tax=Ixodes persulcatus TaxID=34615 RepID=A0AC60PRB9_IXOPE|nr:hypothetical protein HPB47_000587 [Ixodes persulcatus]